MDAKQIMQLIAQGQYDEAAGACERALDRVRREGDLAIEAQLTHLLGVALTRMGRFEEAITMFTRSAQLSFALDNLKGVHASLHGVAEVYQIAGDYDKAWHNLERALDTAEAVGNRAAEAISLAQMVALAQAQQDPERGIPLGEQTYKMMLELHTPPAQVHPLVLNLSKLYLLADRSGDAVLPALATLTTGLRLDKSQASQALTHLLDVTRAVAEADGWEAVGDVGQALKSLLEREDQEAWTPDGTLTGEIASILASFFIDIGSLTAQSPPVQIETVRRRGRDIESFFAEEASLQEWLNAVLDSLPVAAAPTPVDREPQEVRQRAAPTPVDREPQEVRQRAAPPPVDREAQEVRQRAAPPPPADQDRETQELLQKAIADYQGERLDESLLKAGQALSYFRRIDDRYHVAVCLTVLEKARAKLGELEQAIGLCNEAYKIFAALGDHASALSCLFRLSDYALTLGEYARVTVTASQMMTTALQINSKRALIALQRCCGAAQRMLVKKQWAELESLGKGLAASSNQVGEKGWPDGELRQVGAFTQQAGMVIRLVGASGGNVSSSSYREALRLAAQLDTASNRQFNLVALVSSIG